MQLGFVIDQSRCIGCHACTVACKSENDVPVGSFRTWVKYTEQGSFPQVKRSFAVLRCNQCTAAPCVTICPVKALEKRTADGIVDIDPAACIGCKSCMQACPYDAIYINDDTGVAEKCHFCAHRAEVGLAPACAVVCPTEAIVPGDFQDPASVVSTMKAEGDLVARKTEAGTRPNVFYKEVSDAAIDPLQTNNAGGHLWAQQYAGPQLDAQTFEALEEKAAARTVYDVNHPPVWGSRISAYLFTKSIAAGLGIVGAISLWQTSHLSIFAPLLGLIFLEITGYLLVDDLKRPERFYFIFTRPNWDSWLVRGTAIITVYGGLLSIWFFLELLGIFPGGFVRAVFTLLVVVFAMGTAAYTGWLFGQAKGRPLWMRSNLWLQLIVQASVAGSAIAVALLSGSVHRSTWGLILVASLLTHLLFVLGEGRMAPKGREKEYARAHRLIAKGPFADRHKKFGIIGGHVLPLVLVAIALVVPSLTLSRLALLAASVCVLVGLYMEEDTFVRAGQLPPIS